MCRTRNQYHYAVRRVKKLADSIRANKLFEASQRSDMDLLKEMKTVKGKKGSSTLAENVEGADNPSDIVEKFKEVYSALYNSSPSAIQEVFDSLAVNDDAGFEINKITGAKVKEAACRMKPVTSDVSGSY